MPTKKPIRLTHQRAEALLDAAFRGIGDMHDEINERIREAADVDAMAEAKALDARRARAIDAAAIVSHRYLGGPVPTTAPTLFEV